MESPSTSLEETGTYCPACGHLNSAELRECEKCGESLVAPDKLPERGIYCSACGHLNAYWHSQCGKCGTQLVSPDRLSHSGLRERPGCVTFYAILLCIGAGLMALGGALLGISLMTDRYGNVFVGLVIIAIAWVVAVLYFLLARGLWNLRNWARIVIIVLQGLGVLSSLCSMFLALESTSGSTLGQTFCGTVVGLAIGVLIIYWFATHGEYFD